MKDIPNHMVKFIKKFEKEENPKKDEILEKYKQEPSKKQLRKKRKEKQRKEKEQTINLPDTVEEKNKKMKKRIPIIRQNKHDTHII